MSKTVRSLHDTVPPEGPRSQIDPLVEAFCQRWHGGEQPNLLQFVEQSHVAVAALTADERRQLMLRLISLDLDYRWRGVRAAFDPASDAIEQPTISFPARLEDYQAALASVSEGEICWPAELILHELRLRERCGDVIEPAEYLERFPQTPELAELLYATKRLDAEATSLFDGDSTLPPIDDALWREIGPAGDRAADYVLIREIARGGMGVIFEARQLRLNRTVAVKMILDSRLASAEARRRFLVEAQAAARLSHPNIVPVFEVGQMRGQPFFSMAFVDGKSLSFNIAKQGPLPPIAAARLVRQIAQAVQYAHDQGVLHRDLKPQNVLLTSAGEPMITDFGLAKQIGETDGLTLDGQVVGTPGYMAPEQARGQRGLIGARADIYSLGAILYFVLTGRAPFHSSSPAETLRQLLEEEPVPPRRLNPEISADLQTICLKCLQKAPAARYESAAALVADLDRLVNGFPILARPVSYTQRLWRACRRHPMTAMLASAVVLLLLIGVPAAVWYQGQLATSRATARAAEADRLAAQQRANAARQQAAAQREIADTQAYFANLSAAGNLQAGRRLGWRREALARLEQARSLGVKAANQAQLRSEAAACLLDVDLEPLAELAQGPQSAAVAFSHDGKHLAAGQFKAHFQLGALSFQCTVTVVDVVTDEIVHTLRFSVTPLIRPDKRDIVQDGCRVLQFSRDGRWLACGARSGQVHLWDLTQSPPAHVEFSAHTAEIRAAVFSPDSTALYTAATADHELKKWSFDGTNWKGAETVRFNEAISEISFDVAGDTLLVQQRGSWIALVDPASLAIGENQRVPQGTSATATPWPNHVLVEQENDFYVFDLKTKVRSRPFVDSVNGPQSQGYVWQVACSPDGAYCASVTRDDRKLRLWELASRRLVATLPIEMEVFPVVFSPDSRQLAVIGDNRVLLYRIAGGTALAIPTDRYQIVRCFQWHDDVGDIAPAGEFPLTALRGDGQPPMVAAGEPVFAFQISDDAAWAAVQTEDDRLALWQTRAVPPQRLRSLDAPNVHSFQFSADGRRLWAIADSSKLLEWELSTGGRHTRFDHTLGKVIAGRGDLVSLALAGEQVLIGSGGGRVLLADGDRQSPWFWNLETGEITSLAVSGDARLGLCGTQSGAVHLLELATSESSSELGRHEDEILSVAFSQDGRLLAAGSRDRTVRVWRHDGKKVEELVKLRFGGAVEQVEFRPDGKALGIRIQDEAAVRVVEFDMLRSSLARHGLAWPQ
jgi:WD40 repeat protein/tRNA A-37 threonylcarbamoyl transferase component Bud32